MVFKSFQILSNSVHHNFLRWLLSSPPRPDLSPLRLGAASILPVLFRRSQNREIPATKHTNLRMSRFSTYNTATYIFEGNFTTINGNFTMSGGTLSVPRDELIARYPGVEFRGNANTGQIERSVRIVAGAVIRLSSDLSIEGDSEVGSTAVISGGMIKSSMIHGSVSGGIINDSTIHGSGSVSGGIINNSDIYGSFRFGIISSTTIHASGSGSDDRIDNSEINSNDRFLSKLFEAIEKTMSNSIHNSRRMLGAIRNNHRDGGSSDDIPRTGSSNTGPLNDFSTRGGVIVSRNTFPLANENKPGHLLHTFAFPHRSLSRRTRRLMTAP